MKSAPSFWDIFRLDKGKIVEHWDVHEDIIENPSNGNGMF